jgi:hypothetical protein
LPAFPIEHCPLLMCRYAASPLRAAGGMRHISVWNPRLI